MAKSRSELKARFQTNKIPSEADFANLIDAGINQAEDGVRKSPGDPLNIKGEGATQELIAFYKSFEDRQTPAWKINQNPNPDGNPGFNIVTGNGTSRLFIEEKTGAVNIGGINPTIIADSSTLQLGDDTLTNSNGQLLLARIINGAGNRIFKFGVNDQFHLSIGDYGYKGKRGYREDLTIECNTGRTSIKNGLEVNGLLQANGDATVNGKLEAKSTLTISGTFEAKSNTILNGTLEAKGDTIVNGKLEAKTSLIINGTLEAKSNSIINGVLDAKGNAFVYGTLEAKSNAIITGAFETKANATINGVLESKGNTLLQGKLEAKSNAIISGNLEAKADTIVSGKLTTNGDFTISKGFKMTAGIMKWGDGKVVNSNDAGIYSTNPGAWMRFGVKNAPIKFFNNTGDEEVATGNASLWIAENGNVGIGCNPVIKFDVNGPIKVAGVADNPFIDGQGAYINWNRFSGSGQTHFANHRGNGVGGFRFDNTGTNEGFTSLAVIDGSGNLFIKGDYAGNKALKDSDLRVKTNVESSDGLKDLALINKLHIADYDYLGHGKQNNRQKGVIAQELEKLIPEAITLGKGYIADILASPEKVETFGDESLFTMVKPHQLVDGDFVRLIFSNSDTEHVVTVVDEKSFRIEGNADLYKDVLVYGKQVSDFRRVDYQHLFLLNLSATQQLSQKIDALLEWKASLDQAMTLVD